MGRGTRPPAAKTGSPSRRGAAPSGDGRAYVTSDGHRLPFGPADVRGLDEAREHVIEGSTRRSGRRTGGHLYATVEAEMREGQIAFPSGWDADRIMAAARQVIDRPTKISTSSDTRYNLTAAVDGVTMTVQIRVPKAGPSVITVFPDHGPGVKRVHAGELRDVG